MQLQRPGLMSMRAKIVRRFSTTEKVSGFEVIRHWEELECGCVVRPKTDIYGETYADSRICKKHTRKPRKAGKR